MATQNSWNNTVTNANSNMVFAPDAVGGTIIIGGTGQTGTITLGSSSGTNVVAIGSGAGTTTVNIANGVSGNTISIGNGINTSTQVVNIAAGAAGAASTVNILTGVSTSGAQAVNIATGSATSTTNIGNTTGSSLLALKSGTGGISLGTGTTGPIAINPGTTGSVTLGTTSTGNVSIGNTTGTTSIQFGTGSALSTFVDWTPFTPTLVGQSTAGTTTYVFQSGSYMRIGNQVTIQIRINASAATGTGNILIGALPFTINNLVDVAVGACILQNVTFPVGTTSVSLLGIGGTTTANIFCSGSLSAGGAAQMANVSIGVQATLVYRV